MKCLQSANIQTLLLTHYLHDQTLRALVITVNDQNVSKKSVRFGIINKTMSIKQQYVMHACAR